MFNEQKFKAIYDEYLSSGLSVRDYCANGQIHESKFYYWQNKLKGQLSPKRGFVPVVFTNGGCIASTAPSGGDRLRGLPADVSCEICYPNGVSVKLSGLPDAQLLHSLLLIANR
jgi:hypothetical protein